MKTFQIEVLIALITKWPWLFHQTCKMAKNSRHKVFQKVKLPKDGANKKMCSLIDIFI